MFFTAKHTYLNYLTKNKYIISLGSNQEVTTNKKLFDDVSNICNFCINGKSKKEVKEFIKNEKMEENILDLILDKGFLVEEEVNIDDRYSRNHFYYQLMGYNNNLLQENINNQHVLIVGAGGIGNIASFFISSIGVRKISIIDDDVIELSNLNRQFLFREKDIGRYKVDIIKREINALNHNMEINVFNHKLSEEILYSLDDNIDLVLNSADDKYCRNMLNKFCCDKKIPLINAGYFNDISAIGPFYIPSEDSCCLCCDGKINVEENIQDNKINNISRNYKAPSVLTNNFFTGAMLSIELIKFFNKDYKNMLTINNMIGIHNRDFKLEVLNLEKNKHCEHCGK